MKRAILLLLLLPVFAQAQTPGIPVAGADFLLGIRSGVAAEWKVDKRWTLTGEAEFRARAPYVKHVVRGQAGIGAAYRWNPYLETSGEVLFIGTDKYRSDPSFRVRVQGDVKGQVSAGDWRLSLKESVQMTCRLGEMNTWQAPRDAWAMKSRLRAEYRAGKTWRPYAGVEIRNTLNAPTLAPYAYDPVRMTYVTPEGNLEGSPGWMIAGHHDVYINRVRIESGVNIRQKKHRTLRVYLLADYLDEVKIDTNASGTRLKSVVRYPDWMLTGGIRLTFKH